MVLQPSTKKKPGKPLSNDVTSAMEDICAYLEQNAGECQFTLKQLMDKIEGDYKPSYSTVKRRLKEKYHHDVFIFEKVGTECIVCFRNKPLLIDANKEKEKLTVLKEAAALLVNDIRSQVYDLTSYPPSERFLEDVDAAIPESLRFFLSELIYKSKKGSLEQWARKCTAIAHAIASAVRPRSFYSSVLIGVGVYIYKKFGSRHLVDVLSALGFSASYAEVCTYEISSINQPERRILPCGFIQFAFDNADFNVNTLNGRNTFHAMGGIQCVTPANAIEPHIAIYRDTNKKSAAL